MRKIRVVLTTLWIAALLQAADYDVKRLLPGSPFHGVHGLRFDKDDNLYAASVIGQSIYKIVPATKKVTTFIAPPQGMADDLAFAPDGTLAWTSIEDGILHIKSPNGPIRNLVEHQRGVNGVSFSRDGKRLFVSLVFYGDALYEVDRNGIKPPRLIMKDMGGLNGFEVGDDGMIYGPLWFKGKIARINPDTAKLDVIAEGFKTPAAVKLDFKGYAYTPDTGTRDLIRVDLKTGQKKVIAKLRSDLDNLAFNSKGKLFVSLSHLNAIDEVDVTTGQVTQFIPAGKLTSTAGLAVSTAAGHDTLYVADVFGGVRKVNPDTAAVSDTPVDMFQPSHISLSAKHITVVGQVNGFVQQFDRATFKKLAEWNGFKSPGDALELPNGDIVVAETATGNLVRVTDHKILAAGLSAPTALADAGNNAVYVSETGSGQVTRIDLKTGEKSLIAPRLSSPEGLAVAPDGAILVVEVGAKRVTRLDLKTAMRSVIASNLPIGLSTGPSLYRGIAVSHSAIYINSDIENSIYKLTPRK
jgi:DNA-binding beta-propeller fold protein YncE